MNFIPDAPCKVVVRHPDPLIRAGILASLQDNADFEVREVSFPSDDQAAASMNVVIVDYQQAIHQSELGWESMRSSRAPYRTLVVTSNERAIDIQRAMKSGVHGYLLLGGPLSELVDGIQMVARGMRYLCPSASRRMADGLFYDCLTAREHEVLQLVVAGGSNKAIARRLDIELATVKSHLRAIYSKLDATSRTHVANIAITFGLVDERISVLLNAPPKAAVQPDLAVCAGT